MGSILKSTTMFYPKWTTEFNVTDTQISVVYTAILSGGQIGGIISGFLGEGFYTCRNQSKTLPRIESNSTDNKNPDQSVGRTNRFSHCSHHYQHYHY